MVSNSALSQQITSAEFTTVGALFDADVEMRSWPLLPFFFTL